MVNLLEETKKILETNKRSPEDILWCQINGRFSWNDFTLKANLEYDNRSGRQRVNPELQIVGKDFILTRVFDGSDEEWWFMSVSPEKPFKVESPNTLFIR